MRKSEFYFPSSDGKTKLHAIEWQPDNDSHIKGVIQIAHGLNEHISMYESIAKFFTDRLFIVRGEDHIGHGESVGKDDTPLYFGKNGSWQYAADDIYKLRQITREKYGDTPYIMLGFSLGSYLIRDYLIRYNETIDAAIIVGCLYNTPIEYFFGNILSKIISLVIGEKSKSKLLEFIINGTQNKKIKDAKTPLDWLNSNEKEKEKLMHDPLVYGDITVGLFREMLHAIDFTTNPKNIAKMNREIPILFISGKDDPLVKKGKTIEILTEKYKKAGVKNIHKRLYEGRHRVLFEEDQENTLIDIYDWACSKLNTEGKDIEDLFAEYDRYLENIKEGKKYETKNSKNEFFLHTVKTDKAVLVSIEGNLTSISAPKLKDYCNGISVDLATRLLVIDLGETDYIAPAGYDVLDEISKEYKNKIKIIKKK